MTQTPKDQKASAPLHVLLVDDEEDIRDVLGIALEDMGYSVTVAENGKEALALFSAEVFPIVLTDIKMPGMDGIELLKKIKRISPRTEIIMITGHGDMDLAIESFRNEAVEFITKPVDIQTLGVAMSRAREKMKIRQGMADYTENLEAMLLEKSMALKNNSPEKKGSEEILESMEHLPLIVFTVNRDLQIQRTNNLFQKTFGTVQPENKTECYRACRQKSVACESCPALASFEDAGSHQADINYIDTRGESVPCLAWAAPIVLNQQGGVQETLIMATDIRKVMDIKDHLTSLGLMIGSVSHGIKGLLTSLDGGVYLLNSALKKEDRDQAREGLQLVQQMTGKIKKMILDILFYAKDRELHRDAVSASAFVSDLMQTISTRAAALSIDLKSPLPHPDITFQADAGVLHSALINILDNALDACAADASQKDHLVTLKTTSTPKKIMFHITDNGIGMDQDEADKAFTLFHSGKGHKGTGLGLYISRHIIDQHGGSISVQSKKGRGTTFTVTLNIQEKKNK